MGSLIDQQHEMYGQGGGPPMLLDSDFEQQHPRKRRKISEEPYNVVDQILTMASQNKGKTPSPSKLPGGFPPEYSFRALAVYSFLRTLSVRLRLSPFTPNVFLRAVYLPYPNKLLGEVHVSLLRLLLLKLNMGYGFKQKGAATHYYKRRLIDNLRMPLRGGDNLTYLDGLSWPLFFDDYSHLTADRLWRSLVDNKSYADIKPTESDTLGYSDYEDEQFVNEKQTKILHTKPNIFPASAYQPPTTNVVIASGVLKTTTDMSIQPKAVASAASKLSDAAQGSLESAKPTIDGGNNKIEVTSPSTQHSRARRGLPIHKKSSPSSNEARGPYTMQTVQGSSLVYGVEHAVYPGIQLPTSSPERHPGLQHLHGQSAETSFVPQPPLNVDDSVADALRNFMCKIPSQSVISIDQDKSVSPIQFGNDGELPSGDRHFIHFEPMRAMRSGSPYHRLPLSQKLDILEFLVDELLEVPEVEAEFSMRHGSLCVYPYPYAAWPKKSEFESLNNEDECGVCGLEGDLLCCDGCSRSYHKQCIGMKPAEELPEGEWLCPECQVADPSKFGPLYAGQKASVDWVRVSDVSSRIQTDAFNQIHGQSLPSNAETVSSNTQLNANPFQQSTLLGNPNLSLSTDSSIAPSKIAPQLGARNQLSAAQGQNVPQPKNTDILVGTNQQILPCTSVAVPNQLTAVPSQASQPIMQNVAPHRAISDQLSFLIIHGFVFRRKDSDVSGTAPYTVLLDSEVNDCMSRLQLPIAQEWPFRQIPTAFNTGSMHFPSLNNYFLSTESYNPSKYNNKYQRALVPFAFKASGVVQDFSLLSKNFESECNSSTSRLLTEAMQRDMSLDSHIATCLRRQTKFFDPYEIVAGYILKLDASLRRACLMDSCWESGKIRAVHEVWSDNVKKSKSVYRLANLLVKLVDHIHPRAFLEGWNHNSLLKKQESEHMSERNYETLPADWDPKTECRKRRWETTPSNSLMTLCSRENVELSSFVTGINPASIQITTVRSRHKKARTSADKHAAKMMQNVVLLAKEVGTSGSAMDVDRKSPETMSVYVDTSDIVPPQKPYPAYFQFANRRRLEMKEKYPGISSIEISKMLSDIWKNESDEFREKFSIEEMKQRKEYKVAMEEYNKKIRERVAAAQSGAEEKDTVTDADADTKSNDDDSTGVKQSNPKTAVLDNSSSRRSRRSGRIARSSDLNEPSAAPFTSAVSGQASSTTLTSKSIYESKRKHMIAAEKLLKSATQKETFWPLAGRIPFATFGDLPPKVMKRLARSGGAAIAPHVAYTSAHEVGQTCNSHIWRKKAGTCRTFEDLIYQARRLESFLDRQAMHSFEGTVRRGKSQFLKEVRCSQFDPGSGLLHHFVVNKKSGRGCWMSEDMMDVASSTLEQLRRKNRQVDLRRESARLALLAKKLEFSKESFRKQTKVSSAPIEGALPRGTHHLAAQQRQIPSLAPSQQMNMPSRTTANLGAANYKAAASHLQGHPPQPQNDVAGIQMQQLQLALKRHEMDARQLFQTFSMIGVRPTADTGLALRQKNFPVVKSAARQLQKYQPDFLCADTHIIGMMKHVEKLAIGVTLDGFSNSSQVQNGVAKNQQGGAIGANGSNRTGLRNLPQQGSSGHQSFNISQSNPMDGLDPTPIANGHLNGRAGANVSSLVGHLRSQSNSQQNPEPMGGNRHPIVQGASTGMAAGQIAPNTSMQPGSHRTSANAPPNSTGYNQRGLTPITPQVSTMQSNASRLTSALAGMPSAKRSSFGQAQLNQAVGQNQSWNGMGDFQHTPQAGRATSATGTAQSLLQQSRQNNAGTNSQSQVPPQFSHQMLQHYQKQILMGQQQIAQAPGQVNRTRNIAPQPAQNYQNQYLMGQQQIAQAPGQVNRARNIATQRAQNYQNQILMGQQQQIAQAPGQANLARNIASQRAQHYQHQILMGQHQIAQAPGQANLTQNMASQQAQYNQNLDAAPQRNSNQGRSALSQQQMQQLMRQQMQQHMQQQQQRQGW